MKKFKINKENMAQIREMLIRRSPICDEKYEEAVRDIINRVRAEGDSAVFEFTKRFDGAALDADSIEVTADEIESARREISPRLLEVMERAKENIKSFHERQIRNSWLEKGPGGILTGQKFTPVERAGVYVPGGTAAYPSSVLMNVTPAKVAGVREIVMTTPPDPKGEVSSVVLAAAALAGVDRIIKVGGAQAIAALAFGTESIPKADKIVGPGNIYVALAKRHVFGEVGIDSIAGPSEILILADESADPRYVAADMLSQAEHDELASAILVTTSEKLADDVEEKIRCRSASLKRREIIEKSLKNHGCILTATDMELAVDAVNIIAPEHLEIITDDPLATAGGVRNAGAIFLGAYSSEPLGDYMAGPNHVLPTGGTARFFSPLSVDDFTKKSSLIYCTREGLLSLYRDVADFARQEGLDAHANSVEIRFSED